MSLPERTAIPERYRFDLAEIYETPDDWTAASEAFRQSVTALQERAEEPLDSAEDLRALLEDTESLHERKQRLELYATLSRNIATDDEAATDRLRRFRDLESAFQTAVDAVRYTLVSTGGESLTEFVDSLETFRHYAEDFRRQSRYALDPTLAETVAAYDAATETPNEVVVAVINEDFEPGPIERPDGESVELTAGNVRSELSHPDRTYRRRVYRRYRESLDRFEASLTEAYAGKIDRAVADAEVRGYDSVRDRALQRRSYPESGLRCSLSEAVHDTMLDATRSNLEPYHRALALREDRLGVETLRPWDRDVSIADAEPPTIEYEAARGYILEALEPLGASYVDGVEALFDQRRIDVYPSAGKRGDIPAYCPSSAVDGPFILANFREDIRTTFYLCHELGHAMHVETHREGPTRYGTCPRPVSEVPSILHELLLAERFLELGGGFAAAARNRLLECLGGNLYESAMSAAFEHRMVTAVEDGQSVTPERARRAWAELQAEFEAPVAFDDRAGRNWLPPSPRELYSNYQYVLGAAGALAVRNRLREGDLSPATYREVLATTGEQSSLESFQQLGCDVSNEAVYERAATTFDGYVDRLAT
ncbi:MAG: M3 family oligoendopeptidase [Natronomonas sp.]